MQTCWIINTKTKKYVATNQESFDQGWNLKYPHISGATYNDFTTFTPFFADRTANGIHFGYDLCPQGGLFCLYVDMTIYTKDDIENAKRELRRDRDVVSLNVLELKPYAGI